MRLAVPCRYMPVNSDVTGRVHWAPKDGESIYHFSEYLRYKSRRPVNSDIEPLLFQAPNIAFGRVSSPAGKDAVQRGCHLKDCLPKHCRPNQPASRTAAQADVQSNQSLLRLFGHHVVGRKHCHSLSLREKADLPYRVCP